MRLQLHAQIQVAARRAAGAAAAFAGDAHARSIRDAGGNAHLDGAGMPVVTQLQALHAAANRVFEIELERMLDVLALAGPRPRASAARAGRFLRAHAAEERLEEVGERAVAAAAAEHLRHFFFRHRAEAAGAARAPLPPNGEPPAYGFAPGGAFS